jgi:hypothetical protein
MRNAGQDQGAQILSVGVPKEIPAKEEAQHRDIVLSTKLFILKKYTTTSDHTEGFLEKTTLTIQFPNMPESLQNKINALA